MTNPSTPEAREPWQSPSVEQIAVTDDAQSISFA